MPTTKLTKGVIDRIKPAPKVQIIWDSQDKGFGVKVSPAGKITFIVQKRMSATTPTVRISVGDYGVFTVDQARDVAQEHLRTIKLGLPSCSPEHRSARALQPRERRVDLINVFGF